MIVHLFSAFQDRDNLYFVLEIVPGGELWLALYGSPARVPAVGHGGIAPKSAMFYAANVALGLDFIHSHGYAYRDLKPENLLISTSGYLKVSWASLARRRAPRRWR